MAFNKGIAYIPNEEGVAVSVKCPLIDDWIEPVDCMENRDLRDACIPDKFKQKAHWRSICDKCPFASY